MRYLPLALATVALAGCSSLAIPNEQAASSSSMMLSSTEASVSSISSIHQQSSAPDYSEKTDAEWKKILTPEQYYILREAGTETPFTSPLLNEHRKGTFVSADCGEPLFRSETKFDSGTGWPSFYAPISPDAVIEKSDFTLGVQRTEVLSKCGGHLGHVFSDGPQPTGLRYCMNGIALRFIPDEE